MRNHITSVLVQADFVDYVKWYKAWIFPMPIVITDLEDTRLGAMYKLIARLMEVRIS